MLTWKRTAIATWALALLLAGGAAVAQTLPCLLVDPSGLQYAAAANPAFVQPAGLSPVTALASAARTTAQQSSPVTVRGARCAQAVLNVTAASGTGGLTVTLQGQDSASGSWFALNAAPTAVTVVTSTPLVYEVCPGDGAASGGVTQRTAGMLPQTVRVSVAVGDASSYTYSVTLNFGS